MKKTYLDVEPKWVDLLHHWNRVGYLTATPFVMEELEKVCKGADQIRQAQKQGQKSIRI